MQMQNLSPTLATPKSLARPVVLNMLEMAAQDYPSRPGYA